MNTTTKQKRQPSPAQQLKKELKQQYPLLVISCTYDSYSMGASIHVDIKNLHYTPYQLEEIQLFCYRYQNVRTDENGDVLNGGNRYVHINNIIDNDIQTELDQMFLTYLSIYKGYEYIKTVEYNTLIDLPSKHRETYRKLLGNQSYCELPTPPVEITTPEQTDEPQETTPETTQETTAEEIMNTNTPDTTAELKLNNNIENEIKQLTDKLTARNDLLVYLEKNNINGKIQTATEEEIAEIKKEIEELTAKLDPRPELRKYINNVKNSIANDLQKIADATAEENTEEIAFYLNGIAQLNNELSALIKQLAEADIKHAMKAHYSQNDNITPIKLKTAETTQETTTELILTAPPTLDPQNVIQLFPKKKTLDQLRKELTTPESYQNLIDNAFSYCEEYDNLTLHGLQLIRDDYSKKEANGELSPTYDQWCNFMQSYQEVTTELRKKN